MPNQSEPQQKFGEIDMTKRVSTRLPGLSRRGLMKATAGAGLALTTGYRPRPAHAATEKIVFQLDWIPFGRHAPYYAALENGFYSDKGLDVTIVQGRGVPQAIQSVAAGQSQFFFNDVPAMIQARAEGVKIKALACMYQKTPHTLFYLKGSSIAKPKDFENKTIAYTPGDAPRRMFPALAKAIDMDESKVKWLSVDPNSKNAVLLNHQTEGMITYLFTLPVLQKAAQAGDQVGTFVYGDYGVEFYSNGLGALDSYIKEKPQVVRDFVQATMKGVKFALDTPKESVAMLKKHQPQLDDKVALEEIEILRTLTKASEMKTLGFMAKDKMQETQDLMVKYLAFKPSDDIADTYTNDFLA
jgi:NitT/TauT family transport system substrate-binding protein